MLLMQLFIGLLFSFRKDANKVQIHSTERKTQLDSDQALIELSFIPTPKGEHTISTFL